MDLKDLAPKADTLEVILKHPLTGEALMNDGRDEEMTVTIWLPHTKEYKKALYELTDSNLKLAEQDPEKVRKASYLANASLELVSKVTKEWDITLDGGCPKFALAKVKEVYENYPWIKKQVEKAVEDHQNFITTS